MVDKFMEGYGTEENYLRAYGGQVEFPEPEISKNGNLKIVFSRSIVFPQELIADYNSDYIEVVPELKLTEAEKEQIKKDYE